MSFNHQRTRSQQQDRAKAASDVVAEAEYFKGRNELPVQKMKASSNTGISEVAINGEQNIQVDSRKNRHLGSTCTIK